MRSLRILLVCFATIFASCDNKDENYQNGYTAGVEKGKKDGFAEGEASGYSKGKVDGLMEALLPGRCSSPLAVDFYDKNKGFRLSFSHILCCYLHKLQPLPIICI